MTASPAGTTAGLPDIKVSVRQLFGIDTDMEVPAFSGPTEHVPTLHEA
jgi:cobaltochelatase CobS